MILRLIRLYFIFPVTLLIFICLHTYIQYENSTDINDDFTKLFYTDEQGNENELPINVKSKLNGNKEIEEVNRKNLSNRGEFTRNSSNSGGGPPIYILWTRWRSGSSLLGQILAYAKKNTFYSYEPLHAFGLNVLREDDEKTKIALKFLFNSMKCRYDLYNFMVNYFIETEFYYFYNPMTKKTCRPVVSCNSSTILNEYCKAATTQVVKLLRLSLKYGEYVLKKNPQIKIIYLVRDPRAVFLSRSRLPWCSLDDCKNPKITCELLQVDVNYAIELHRLYPERFIFIRYEDLALNPEETFRSIWEKLGQKYTSRIDRLIEAFTSKGSAKGIYGLQKNSKKRAFNWRSSLSYKKMSYIQDSCGSVMKNLGYAEYSSQQHYINFSQLPLETFWNSSLNEFSLNKELK